MNDKSDPSTTRRQLLVGAGLAVAATSQIASDPSFAQPASAAAKIKAVAFDLFTIFNPLSVDDVIEQYFPGKGKQIATAWRTRIFEYCWLRTLNQNYVDFWQVLNDALTFTNMASPSPSLAPSTFVPVRKWTLDLSPPAAMSRGTMVSRRPSSAVRTTGGLCREAPALPVTRPSRSPATRSIDNSLGGFLLHW